MTSGQWCFLGFWVCCTALNFWAMSRGMWSDKTEPWIAHVGVLMVAMIPLATPVVIFWGVRAWFRRHWEIVKIERSLRD